jgi:hypothetical protein
MGDFDTFDSLYLAANRLRNGRSYRYKISYTGLRNYQVAVALKDHAFELEVLALFKAFKYEDNGYDRTKRNCRKQGAQRIQL